MNWKLLKQIAGVLLIVIGLLALFTPLTPGAWLIFVGAELAGIGLLSRKNLFRYYEKLKVWWRGRQEEKKNENEISGP